MVRYIQSVIILRCYVAHWNEIAQNKTIDILDDTKMSLDPLLFVSVPPFLQNPNGKKSNWKLQHLYRLNICLDLLSSPIFPHLGRFSFFIRNSQVEDITVIKIWLGHMFLYALYGIMYNSKWVLCQEWIFKRFMFTYVSQTSELL